MNNFCDRVLFFNENLIREFKFNSPNVEVINPFHEDPNISKNFKKFYNKFFNDQKTRRMILGINPGRLGSGITGIPFTDSKRLTEDCKIPMKAGHMRELSSEFIYEVIHAYGGAKKFYDHFYISSVCPVGFVERDDCGKPRNLNYYDNQEINLKLKAFIVNSIRKQLEFGIDRSVCFRLGSGKNSAFLLSLNSEYNFFERIIPLPHPRYIMQYKSKEKEQFLSRYIRTLTEA